MRFEETQIEEGIVADENGTAGLKFVLGFPEPGRDVGDG